MPNKNYQKGRAKEYRVMEMLRSQGYNIVARTAGSHGIFDVIGICTETHSIRLIQCKPASMSKAAKEKLLDEYSDLNKGYRYSITFEVL